VALAVGIGFELAVAVGAGVGVDSTVSAGATERSSPSGAPPQPMTAETRSSVILFIVES
jgi:hypothetical protein